MSASASALKRLVVGCAAGFLAQARGMPQSPWTVDGDAVGQGGSVQECIEAVRDTAQPESYLKLI